MRLTLGDGPSRRSVTISIKGHRLTVVSNRVGAPEDRKVKDFDDPASAERARDRIEAELRGRGYVADDPEGSGIPYGLAEEPDEAPTFAPLPGRVPRPSTATASPSSKPKRRRKRQRRDDERDDPKVLAGLALVALAAVGLVAFLIWTINRPGSVVGSWRTSRGFQLDPDVINGPTTLYTFRRDGTATKVVEGAHLFLDGTYNAADGRLTLRFDRGHSWEEGDFDLGDDPDESTFNYHLKGGWLHLEAPEGGTLLLAPLRDGDGPRVARGGPSEIEPAD